MGRRSGKAGHSRSGNETFGMPGFQSLSLQGKLVSIGPDPLRSKKILDPVAQHLFSFVFSPPGPIHGPVAGGTPGVEGKMSRGPVPVADIGRAVKIGIVGSKARRRLRCMMDRGPPR